MLDAGGSGGTRTPGPLVRSQVLYPTELQIRDGAPWPADTFQKLTDDSAVMRAEMRVGRQPATTGLRLRERFARKLGN